jgi:hypothetical protein
MYPAQLAALAYFDATHVCHWHAEMVPAADDAVDLGLLTSNDAAGTVTATGKKLLELHADRVRVTKSTWYPDMPLPLPYETTTQYTDRLTGADKTDRVPYDHRRNRQCSIGWHHECSDPRGASCECPCHTADA